MKLHCFRKLRALLLAPVVALTFAQAGKGAPFTAYLVKDINPGSGTSGPGDMIDFNGTLYFSAADVTNGHELWKSDGTAAGTVLVRDINPAGSSIPQFLTMLGGSFVFPANDGTNGVELWASDGTTAGTVLLKDINPGPSGSGITNFELDSTLNGVHYFEADNGAGIGDELWRTDGTTAGTYLVKDIRPGSGNSNPDQFHVANGIQYFVADNGSTGDELFRTDGTPDGTVLVKDIRPGGNDSSPTELIGIGSTLYFWANDGTNGIELWKSDGTEANTVMVKDIASDGSGNPQSLTNLNGTLFFQADDRMVARTELWKSDGTEAGTVLVKDINVGSSAFGIETDMHVLGNSLIFQANDGVNGIELWTSDGTEAGTQMLIDLSPGNASSTFAPSTGLVVGDQFFFAASVPDGARFDHSLFVTDGTAAGTMPIRTLQDLSSSGVEITDMAYSGGRLFFRAPIDIDPTTGAASNFELFAVNVVPEPATFVLMLGGVIAAMMRRRRFIPFRRQ